MNVLEARRLLGVAPDDASADIDRAFRRAVAGHHPDHGGDPDTFRSLLAARDLLRDPEATVNGWEPPRSPVRVIPRQTHWWDPVVRFLLGQPAPVGRRLD